MNRSFTSTSLTSASLVLLLIGACTTPDGASFPDAGSSPDDSVLPDAADIDGQQALAAVDANLERLAALEIVDVIDLVEVIPEGSANCYSLPCNAEDERVIEEAAQEQAVRLARLVAVAEGVSGGEIDPATCEESAIAEHLDILQDLEIVEVGSLMAAEPERNCPYNLPCEEDIAAAAELTCQRASDLAHIVDFAPEL